MSDELQRLDDSYLRIRAKLSRWGSYNTKFAGTDRFEKTEEALDKLISQRAALLAALQISRGQWIHSVNAEQCLEAIKEAIEF